VSRVRPSDRPTPAPFKPAICGPHQAQFFGAAAASTAYAANAVNQYSTVGAATLTYDGNGNLTGDGVDSFAYDTENHLLSASALGNTIAYTYDPLGRRASKTVNGTVTDYVDAGNQEIAEYDGSGTLLVRYVYGADASAPVATIAVSANSRDAILIYCASLLGFAS
jgi:YD repeat-containing protein